MTEFYDHLLHKTYQLRLNTEINIKNNIFEAIEDFIHLEKDYTIYPRDQKTLLNSRFPLAGTRNYPNLQMTDYIMCINNYRDGGNLFTVRFVHPVQKYSEVLFLDPNTNGQLWLLVISPNLKVVEDVKKYGNIDLTNDTINNGIF